MTKGRRLRGCLQALSFLSGPAICSRRISASQQSLTFRTAARFVKLDIRSTTHVLLPLLVVMLFRLNCAAGVTAGISGTVKDDSGAIVGGATVFAQNIDTGVVQNQRTNLQGFYSFQSLPLGHYEIRVEQTGFKTFREGGLVLDVNDALVVDVTLHVGQIKEVIEVSSETQHVETSSSQLGEVIGSREMTDVPLVTRSYTDLLALQPGVVPTSSGLSGALPGPFNSTGVVLPLVSGDEIGRAHV